MDNNSKTESGTEDAVSVDVQRLVSPDISKGLIIRKPHIGKILDGEKTWEMRSSKTKIRGKIALIEAGSGLIVGECKLVRTLSVPPWSWAWKTFEEHHRIPKDQHHLMMKWKYAWVVENAIRYDKPIPYKHPQGAVIWVNLANV